MSLKPCTECKKDVSTKAKTCPSCGAPAPKDPSYFLYVLGGIVVLGLIGNAFSPSSSSSPQASATQSVASAPEPAPTTPKLTPEAREKIVKEATQGMQLERDKVEKVSFYTPKGSQFYDDNLTAYLAVPDDRKPYVRIVFAFHGDSWIFWKRAKVMANDAVIWEKHFTRVSRDNNTAGVFESVDFPAGAPDLVALSAVSKAKTVTLRLAGTDKLRDFDLKPAALQRLDAVLKAHAKLTDL